MAPKNTNPGAGDSRVRQGFRASDTNSANTEIAAKTQGATRSWRDLLPVHPAADLFRPMSPDELRALGENIKTDELRVPIVLWKGDDGKAYLLDGRCRLTAIEAAFGSPLRTILPYLVTEDGQFVAACDKVVVLDNTVDPYAFAISNNLNRRHLTAADKRNVIAALIKQMPPRRQNRMTA